MLVPFLRRDVGDPPGHGVAHGFALLWKLERGIEYA